MLQEGCATHHQTASINRAMQRKRISVELTTIIDKSFEKVTQQGDNVQCWIPNNPYTCQHSLFKFNIETGEGRKV